METKELNDLKQSLKKQYFDSTGRDVDKHHSSLKMFIEHIRSDVQKLTIKLLHLQQDSELLANCLIQNNLYTNIINIQDSVISLKDSVNASLEDMYKQKVKKVKRQRNVATGVALVEFLVILGLISKI